MGRLRQTIHNQRKKALNLRGFAANNIVAFDDGRDPNRFRLIFFLLIHANHTAVRANKYFGATGNFRRQSPYGESRRRPRVSLTALPRF